MLPKLSLTTIFLFTVLVCMSQNGSNKQKLPLLRSFFSANLTNVNVYKTQKDMELIPVYKDLGGTKNGNKSYVLDDTKDTLVRLSVENAGFIRYKVVKKEGDNTYIRILKGCEIKNTNTIDTIRIDGTKNEEDAENYIYKVKSSLEPRNHYLASSAIIGTGLTLPIRFRELDGEIDVSGSFNIAYGFGWKFKLGNHPYHAHYLNIIPYAVGLGTQKYFVRNDDSSFSDKEDEIALTYMAMGMSYEWEKFNIGLFAGQDIMFGAKKNWEFNDDWWFGIGIGYKLFKRDE